MAEGAMQGLLLHKSVNQEQSKAVVCVLLSAAGAWMAQAALCALLS